MSAAKAQAVWRQAKKAKRGKNNFLLFLLLLAPFASLFKN
jgi:hypothetical protein